MGMSTLGDYKKYTNKLNDIEFLKSEAKISQQNQFDKCINTL